MHALNLLRPLGGIAWLGGRVLFCVRADGWPNFQPLLLVLLLSWARRFDAVVHFAGRKYVNESVEDPLRYYDHNVLGTINLAKVGAGSQARGGTGGKQRCAGRWPQMVLEAISLARVVCGAWGWGWFQGLGWRPNVFGAAQCGPGGGWARGGGWKGARLGGGELAGGNTGATHPAQDPNRRSCPHPTIPHPPR